MNEEILEMFSNYIELCYGNEWEYGFTLYEDLSSMGMSAAKAGEQQLVENITRMMIEARLIHEEPNVEDSYPDTLFKNGICRIMKEGGEEGVREALRNLRNQDQNFMTNIPRLNKFYSDRYLGIVEEDILQRYREFR